MLLFVIRDEMKNDLIHSIIIRIKYFQMNKEIISFIKTHTIIKRKRKKEKKKKKRNNKTPFIPKWMII